MPLYECEEAFAVLAYIPTDYAYGGKLFGLRLRDIEYVGISEPGEPRVQRLRIAIIRLISLLPLGDDWGKNADAALALPDVAAKLSSRMKAGHMGGSGSLSRNSEDVTEAAIWLLSRRSTARSSR